MLGKELLTTSAYTRWMHHSGKNAACPRDTTTPATAEAQVKSGGQRYTSVRLEEFATKSQLHELPLISGAPNRPFSGRRFTVTVGKEQVYIIILMMAEFYLAALVSGLWYCPC